MSRSALGATYRLQLGPDLGFDEAASLVDYLGDLGVECLYCSPIAEAVPGSTHGYDGTDPTAIRAELGGAAAFRRLAHALGEAGLGCVVDIVPNHLSTWPGGPWWRELLRSGRDGEMGEVFDIDWDAADDKVLLPVLDRPLDKAIAEGLLVPRTVDGEESIGLGNLSFPVRGGKVGPDDDLADVLEAQCYRLVDWRSGARNYRRFFDIDGLVGVRVEGPEVFSRTHRLIGDLVGEGLVTALRVDHVDGLADPEGYLRRLAELTGGAPVVVEKILTGEEHLRASWPVVGTTGYEAIDDIGGALVDADGFECLAAAAGAPDGTDASIDGGAAGVEACTVATRRLVGRKIFADELDRVAALLGLEPAQLTDATARLPVYRTYFTGGAVHADDTRAIAVAAGGDEAVEGALGDPRHLAGVLAWQQVTGAVMAKGVEDTAWYRLPGRLAFCEVGGDPGRERGDGRTRLHERAAARAASGATGLVPSTTHDTKRSGDARARLYALSELAGAFEDGLGHFTAMLGDAPNASGPPIGMDRVLLEQARSIAQLVLAVLPPGAPGPRDVAPDPAMDRELAARVANAQIKAIREAKLRSSWAQPDLAYEERTRALVQASLARGAEVVQRSFGSLVEDVARLGATLSLSSVLLRSTLPGLPDCYQGDESWNFALVDPDNRRPVDFARLRARLASISGPGARWTPVPGRAAQQRAAWTDGRVKMLVTAACLHARARLRPALSPSSAHLAMHVSGPAAASIVAFARVGEGAAHPGAFAIAIATRLAGRLDAPTGDLPAGGRAYRDTVIELPAGIAGPLTDCITGRPVAVRDGRLLVADALAELPVALLGRA